MSEINTWSITAANNNSAPPNGWPESTMNYSDVNNSARENMAAIARWFADSNGTLTTAGSANAYTLTPNRTITAYTAGLDFVVKASFANTGAATINVSALGAKDIRNLDGAALASGDIAANRYYRLVYQGTYFLLMPWLVKGDFALSGHNHDSAYVAEEFREMPQNVQNAIYTLVLTDSGKHIYHSDATAYAHTIPPNSSVAFDIGTVVSWVNAGSGVITITQGAGVTIRRAGTGTAGNVAVAQYGVATAIKTATDTWYVSGSGLS